MKPQILSISLIAFLTITLGAVRGTANDVELLIEKSRQALKEASANAPDKAYQNYTSNWSDFIQKYKSVTLEDEKSDLLDYWNSGLREDETYRSFQLAALKSNYSEDLVNDTFYTLFNESHSRLELIPMSYILAKHPSDESAAALDEKFRSVRGNDEDLQRLLARAISWMHYWKAVADNPNFGADDPFNPTGQPSPGPNSAAPTVDLPRMIEAHKRALEDEIVEEPPVEIAPDPQVKELPEVIEEVTVPEPAIEEAPEVVTAEPIEEGVEKSSNWWLWLVGVVVVVGGFGLVLRRKS